MKNSIQKIHQDILNAYGSLDCPSRSFIGKHDTTLAPRIIECLGKKNYKLVEDFTDDNYNVCSSLAFCEPEIEYTLSISYVGLYAVILPIKPGVPLIPVDVSKAQTSKLVMAMIHCLRKFQISCLDFSVLSQPFYLNTEIRDPQSATIYNSLFSDTAILPWEAYPEKW